MALKKKQAKRGAPTAFNPAFVEQARKLAQLGATDRESAEFFGVSEATLHRWKHTHPDFCESLKIGKEAADARVEQSLYRRATGYTFDSEKLFAPAGTKEVLRAPIVEHVPPDVTACIFWLKNRKRADWRDKWDVGDDGSEPAVPVKIEVVVKDARAGNADPEQAAG